MAITGTPADDTLVDTGGADLIADLIEGLSGDDSITGLEGNDTPDGGSSADVVRLSADVVVSRLVMNAANMISTERSDRISDWQDGIDSIRITSGSWQGHVYDSFDDLHIGQSGANAVIRLGGTTITLAGTDADVLGASDFHFV